MAKFIFLTAKGTPRKTLHVNVDQITYIEGHADHSYVHVASGGGDNPSAYVVVTEHAEEIMVLINSPV